MRVYCTVSLLLCRGEVCNVHNTMLRKISRLAGSQLGCSDRCQHAPPRAQDGPGGGGRECSWVVDGAEAILGTLCFLCFFSSCISNRLADFVLPDSQGGWGTAGRQKYCVFSWGERRQSGFPTPGQAPPWQSPLSSRSSTETTEPPVLLELGRGTSLS